MTSKLLVGTCIAALLSFTAYGVDDANNESGAGDLLLVHSAFTRIGDKSLTMSQRMTNAETGVLCATQDVVEVFFDVDARKAAPMPQDIREKLDEVVVTAGSD